MRIVKVNNGVVTTEDGHGIVCPMAFNSPFFQDNMEFCRTDCAWYDDNEIQTGRAFTRCAFCGTKIIGKLIET